MNGDDWWLAFGVLLVFVLLVLLLWLAAPVYT